MVVGLLPAGGRARMRRPGPEGAGSGGPVLEPFSSFEGVHMYIYLYLGVVRRLGKEGRSPGPEGFTGSLVFCKSSIKYT